MPDEFLTIDEVAQRMALPPDMIRRRIESGDIPVHWVEVFGKLEMRVAAEDVGGSPGPGSGSPFPATQTAYERPAEGGSAPPDTDYQAAAGEAAAEGWQADDEGYSQRLWSPAEPEPANPWGTEPQASEAPAPAAAAEDVPVWRPDPATWEDEPLQGEGMEPARAGSPSPAYAEPEASDERLEVEPGEAEASTGYSAPAPEELGSPPFVADASSDEEEREPTLGFEAPAQSESFAAPPAPAFPAAPAPPEAEDEASPFAIGPESGYEPAEDFPPAAPETEYQPAAAVYAEADEAGVAEEDGLASGDFGAGGSAPAPEADVEAPSAMVTAPVAASMLGAIDARELVAGLFERWERALEQRIQAEQRLRFEAELEQRMRQVRDLRQELDQTRKSQAAETAEREQELMQLRDKIRDLEHGPKRRSLFGR